MKEQIWGRVVSAKLEAWGLLLAGLLIGVLLAFCAETAQARHVANYVDEITDSQSQVVEDTVIYLAEELALEEQARLEFLEKVANAKPPGPVPCHQYKK